MNTRCTAQCFNAARKVRISVQMRLDCRCACLRRPAKGIPNPANHAHFGRVLHVADQPRELA
eukprot:8608336-Alexandrium_andersonii.AAC.1